VKRRHLNVKKNGKKLAICSKNCQKWSFFKMPMAIFLMTVLAIILKNGKFLAV